MTVAEGGVTLAHGSGLDELVLYFLLPIVAYLVITAIARWRRGRKDDA